MKSARWVRVGFKGIHARQSGEGCTTLTWVSRLQTILPFALGLALLCSTALRGQDLPVAGDAGHLWVLRPGPEASFLVLHRGPTDPPNRLLGVETLQGRVQPGGIAATGDELWLIYTNGTVQRIWAEPTRIAPGWTFPRTIESPLPAKAPVVAMAASRAGPWVLTRLTPAQMPEPPAARGRATDPDATERAMRNIALGLPPNYVRSSERRRDAAAPETPADAPPVSAPEAETAEAPAQDVLLHLGPGAWRPVPLPEDWPQGAEAALVATAAAPRPTLLTRQTVGAQTRLRVYEPEGETGWSRSDYTLAGDGATAALVVQGHTVIVQQQPSATAVELATWVIGGGEAMRTGELAIEAPPGSAWGAAPMGLTAAVMVELKPPVPAAEPQTVTEALFPKPPPLHLTWARIDLNGAVVQPPAELEPHAPDLWALSVDYAVVGVIALLTLVMVVILWRRDPAANQPQLPAQTVIADLGRRALAGLIDFLPVAFGVMQAYGLGFQELLQYHWPRGGVGDIEVALPGVWVIGVFVAHTTVAELFFHRSIGKAFTGLRVSDMAGGRPRAWQVLVRGLLKTIDLLAWLLLILPIIGPFRQRLGDVLARTLVVMPRPEDEEAPSDDENESE